MDFHLAAGVDLIVVETDAPVRIADRFARHGAVEVVQGTAVTAAGATAADWLIKGDVNEFWWPRGGTLKELLEAVAPRYGKVQALARRLVPVTDRSETILGTHDPSARARQRRAPLRASSRRSRRPARRGPWLVSDGSAALSGQRRSPAESTTRTRCAVVWRRASSASTRGSAMRSARSPTAAHPTLRAATSSRRRVLPPSLTALGEADIIEARDRMDELEARLAALESSFGEVVKRKLRGLRTRS